MIMRIKKTHIPRLCFLLAFLLTFLPEVIFAQEDIYMQEGAVSSPAESNKKEKASPDSALVSYLIPSAYGSYQLRSISNASLYRLQDYDVIQHSGSLHANLGNIGSASYPLAFLFNTNQSFDLLLKNFTPYQFSFDSTRFYISDSPYSKLDYVMGSAKEQRLMVIHSQQIRKGLTVALNARFANAPGYYERQRTFYTGVTANVSYFTPGNRYGVIAAYLHDRFSIYENGGLKYDTVFSDNIESKRKTILVNLDEAVNRYKSDGLMIQHFFNLQKSQIREVDSTGLPLKTRRFDAGRFVHTFRYNRNSVAFEDNTTDTLSLPGGVFISRFTYDTSALVHFENNLVYSNIEPDTSSRAFPLQYAFGIKQIHDRIFNDTYSRVFSHLVPFGTLRGIIAGKTFFTTSGSIHLGDYNNGDFDLSGEFYQFIGRKNDYRLWLSARNGLIHPDYFYQRYLSGHFNWENDFKAQGFQIGTAGIEIKGIMMSASVTRVSNFVYLNNQSLPAQLSDGIGVVSFNFYKDLKLGRWIIGGHGTWQQTTNEAALKLPSIFARLTIGYNFNLFKNALRAQAGIDIRYNSAYYANAYNPELRSFYVQDLERYGNYPYGDVFVNFKVKRARIFVKYQHANAGLLGYTYMMVPGYPQADASLKFGVSWVFFD